MGSITRAIANNLTNDLGGAGGINFKNILINGDMSIAQRGTSTSSVSTTQYASLDRFQMLTQTAGSAVFTLSQDTDVPSGQGFAKSNKIDVTTALGTYASSNLTIFRQRIEGQNLQYLKKGTSSAESLTLSFWVKSNKTGTYVAEILDSDNSNRHINKSYTISSANTWEKKTITFAGDTTGGTLNNDNGVSLDLGFWLGAGTTFSSGTLQTSWGANTSANRAVGQVNLADNTANEWFITGVQLEAGTSASDFEFLPHDVNLQRCQRYYYSFIKDKINEEIGCGGYYSNTQIFVDIPFPVTMRADPTLDFTSGTDYYGVYRNSAHDTFNSFTIGQSGINLIGLYNNSEVSGTAGHAGFFRTNNASSSMAFNSEL